MPAVTLSSARRIPIIRLKAFLSFIVFVVVTQLLEAGLGWLIVVKLKLFDPNDQSWRPSLFIAYEGVVFLTVLVATLVVARIQKRRFADYGFAAAGAARYAAVGSAWGLGAVVLLVGVIGALGGFTLGGLALHGTALLSYSIAWLVTMFLVGLAEEGTFRATGMFTLGEVIGLWPTAIVTTLIFAALHYFQKPNENVADALSVGLLGLFMAFTIVRTGSIWWAVGFHALFDYAALFLFGAPNTGNNGGQPIATRLLTGSFHGPQWLTGGRTGIEASWLIFPIIALLFFAFDRTYRATAPSSVPAAQP